LGRVVFTRKAEAAVDWFEIESRLQDISVSSDISIAPSAALANDPTLIASGERVVSLSSHHDISQPAIAAFGSSNKPTTR